MNRRRFLTSLAAGASVALAGCTSGDSGSGGTTTTQTTASTATVRTRSTDTYGQVLVDTDGLSLYVFDKDTDGESSCYDSCAENWPPLTVDGDPTASAAVSATLGTTERNDGSMQVTVANMPLYYYAGDSQPGDTTGQAVGDVWWLVAPDGSKITQASTQTTDSGMY